jgi:hypothetical protein
MAKENGAPKDEETISISRADLQELLTNAMANAAKIAAEAGNAARDHRRDDVDFLATIMAKPSEERETALIAYLSSLSPQQREARETSIRDAYANIAKTADPSQGRPGELAVLGKDNAGAPVYGKVRTTRDWVLKNYPQVDVYVTVPPRGGVTIRGVNFVLERGINHVPSIVAELYAWWAETQERIERSYPPLTAAESENMNTQLARGARQVISRVHQVGVGILPQEVIAEPARTE